MNLTTSLLYLLLLYAVLDKDGKMSLTTGLIIAFLIMLVNCYVGNGLCLERLGTSNLGTTQTGRFSTINGC